jgi:hypothetical protein
MGGCAVTEESENAEPAIAPDLSADEEKGLIEALDEADRGDVIDGPAAIAEQKRRVRGAA